MQTYTTKMDAARKGIITPEMEIVAKKEYRTTEEKLPTRRQGWQTGSRHSEKTVCSGCRHLRKIRFSCWFFP